MPSGIHILNFAKNLASHKYFLKSLTTNSLFKRKVIIQKATDKELRLLPQCGHGESNELAKDMEKIIIAL